MSMTPEEREKATSVILFMLRHNMVNQSYVADKLYDGDTRSNRSRLNHRINGKYKWQEAELRRVLEIFEQFADEIDKARDAVADIAGMRADYESIVAQLNDVAAQEQEESLHEEAVEQPA